MKKTYLEKKSAADEGRPIEALQRFSDFVGRARSESLAVAGLTELQALVLEQIDRNGGAEDLENVGASLMQLFTMEEMGLLEKRTSVTSGQPFLAIMPKGTTKIGMHRAEMARRIGVVLKEINIDQPQFLRRVDTLAVLSREQLKREQPKREAPRQHRDPTLAIPIDRELFAWMKARAAEERLSIGMFLRTFLLRKKKEADEAPVIDAEDEDEDEVSVVVPELPSPLLQPVGGVGIDSSTPIPEDEPTPVE